MAAGASSQLATTGRARPGIGNWQLTEVPPWLWCYLRRPILAMIVRYRSTSFFLT